MNSLRSKWILVVVGSLMLTGCGGPRDQPGLGTVTGKVTMDGEPLSRANVIFGPVSGRPSSGVTNKDGQYELTYLDKTKGAKVGAHVVAITTFYEEEDSPEALNTKEKIPVEYNLKTTLKAEVKPGKNAIDFDLKSK